MKVKNEHGVTLVELLVTILILGLIVIPISTYLLTGTYTRTISQGKENQLLYFAQEVMESIRHESSNHTFAKGIGTYKGDCVLNTGCQEAILTNPDARYELIVSEFLSNPKFVEVKVIVTSSKEVAAPVELVTVVKKRETP